MVPFYASTVTNPKQASSPSPSPSHSPSPTIPEFPSVIIGIAIVMTVSAALMVYIKKLKK
jgi:hypothetical protein